MRVPWFRTRKSVATTSLPEGRESMFQVSTDTLSFDKESTEVAGFVTSSGPNYQLRIHASLLLVERTSLAVHERPVRLRETDSNALRFKARILTSSISFGDKAPILDVYLVVKTCDEKFTYRLDWPEDLGDWYSYSTVHGNLSFQKSEQVGR